jgi:hypothetical protein
MSQMNPAYTTASKHEINIVVYVALINKAKRKEFWPFRAENIERKP